jgi:integrase
VSDGSARGDCCSVGDPAASTPIDHGLHPLSIRGLFCRVAEVELVMVGDHMTRRGLMRGGAPALPWRNLRHHAATWLHNTAGLPWEEVSNILGHHSVAFTLETYVRRGSDSDAETRRRLDQF